MGVVVQIIGLAMGYPTEHDGRWLVSYDPHSFGGRGLIQTTDRRSDARVFSGMAEFHEMYTEASGMRPDGKPNRPLTAFHLRVEQQ